MLKIIEHKIIKEAYDDSAPSWIKDLLKANLATDQYNAHNYDLSHAQWHEEDVPTSPSDPRLKDKNRISYFLMPNAIEKWDRKQHKYVKKDIVLSYNASHEDWAGGWNYDLTTLGFRSNASFKTLLPYFTKYAWIEKESNKQNAKEIRDKRAELKDGAIALQRHMASYWQDEDKSGYIVDKDKYKRLLVSKKASKMVQDACNEVNDCITKAKSAINDFVNNLSSRSALYSFKSKEAFHYLSDLFYYANQCNAWLEQLDNGKELNDAYIYEIPDKISKAYDKLLKCLPTNK